ncbi:MAG: hypothetical protein KDD29_11330, partial [Flavobacteriales bacterium]|nr:hypothetical protein [Flavobacteriales bacterium]
LFAQSSVAFAEEFPTPDEVSESQKKDVMCALILDSDDKKLSEHVFCDPRHKGLVCNYGINFPKKVCNSPDKVWYQKSIDEAAQIYSRNSNIKPKIKLSAGTMKIQYLFSAHWPYGDYIGIHLKEGVGLEGHSYGKYNSYIRLTPFKLKSFASNKVVSSSDKIRALILVAKNKIYQNPNETVLTETSNNSIKNIYLSGHSGGDIGCRDINDEEVRVGSAIFAAGVTDLKLYNINAFHFTGNIFEIGAFLPWVKEDSACNGIECIGKRMWVKGRDSSHPVTIKNNKLCDGNFGGIVLVGENIELENNEIKFIKKTWDINKSGYGLTMGISASFAGTQNIKIVNNDIEGGDYGIGSDGSFPLAVTVQLFNEYSEQIVNALGQETMLKYPNGIATQDRILLEGLDFVRGQQVLFNIASKNAVDKNIETGFGSNIFLSYNKVKDAVTGISLYRMKNSVIGNNKIESNDKGFVGIGIYDTYDTALYLNSI